MLRMPQAALSWRNRHSRKTLHDRRRPCPARRKRRFAHQPASGRCDAGQAADGYRVAFSLAELDPKLGNHKVLVANACDGKALSAADSPLRLVVPGEVRAARSVRQIRALRLVALP
jgi:hypothetical protein